MPEEENNLEEEIVELIKDNIPDVVFPDIQKVEITNLPEEKEQKDPVINVTVPPIKIPPIPPPEVTVNVPEPKVEVIQQDLTELLKAIRENKVEMSPTDLSPLIDKFEELAEEIKNTSNNGYKGGGIGPLKQNLMNIAGVAINPATEDKQDDVIDSTDDISENIKLSRISLQENVMCQKKILKQLEILTEVEFEDHNVEK